MIGGERGRGAAEGNELCHADQDRPSQASRESDKLLAEARRRHPGDSALMMMECRKLLELARAPDAPALSERRLRSAPADAAALNGKGAALDMLHRHAEAQAASLLEAAPRTPQTQAWPAQLQTLARNLATPGAAVPPGLRQAMPQAPGPCPAAI
jgi:hypothetical protein